ncbi:ROK family transcriptional regulator [Chelativorans intermedius]|uniref:ROK family protein n=1 Tax=Chelativorans intermedius TaxID=515947 RepID=A0ABV6DAK7_9HYPH|nr:ROK family transcriptional regulator [Chelativorans intermedius]MCT8997982.1 ROK family transcriptional regulator [Chelativorans intermedius]
MTAGIRHDEMRKRNRALVIAAVRRAGQPSRTEIARQTGLSHSTISAIASDLIEEGIMREVGQGEAAPARRGRPQVALGLDPEAASVACLHLSFNSLSAVLVDYRGRVIDSRLHRLETLRLSREALLAAAVSAVREISAGRGNFLRIAVAVQGITDAAGSRMLWSPITPHSDLDFGGALEAAFGVPVTVQNDCNMIAAALRWRNPRRYRDNFVAILLSHGIGMGLMLNGKLFTGTRSSAGEFGHMIHRPEGALCRCGKRGCIEAYAGNYAIWRRARGRSAMEEPVADVEPGEMEALAAMARQEEGPARQAFREAAEAIGYGIGSLFALIDPAPVAIVGQGTAAFDILEPEIRAALARTAGGQHADAISFETWPDEEPFIQHGCAMTALSGLDWEVFGPGMGGRSAENGRIVA